MKIDACTLQEEYFKEHNIEYPIPFEFRCGFYTDSYVDWLIGKIDTVHWNACREMMYACRKEWDVDMTDKIYPPYPEINIYSIKGE